MKRNASLDILKLILSFMVVGIHTQFLSNYSIIGRFITVNGIFRIAVPIFFLINGYYFYNVLKNNNSRIWFKKLIILYLFWMLTYSYFWFDVDQAFRLIRQLVLGYGHLWYLSGMLGGAILLIILKDISLKLSLLMIFFTFILGVILQYFSALEFIQIPILQKLSNYDWVHRNFLFLSYPFLHLGYLINKYDFHKLVNLSWCLLLFSICLSVFEVYFSYKLNSMKGWDNLFFLLLFCPSLFVVILNFNFSFDTKNISMYAASIYFVHFFYSEVIKGEIHNNGLNVTFLVLLLSIITSFFVVRIFKKYGYIL